MKAISAIIVVVLLLLISISLISVVYVWSSALTGTVTSTTEETTSELTKQLSGCLKIDAISKNQIYLRNCGKGVITNNSLSVFIDDVKVGHSVEEIGEDQTGTVNISGLWKFSMDRHNLKLTNGAAFVQALIELEPNKDGLVGYWDFDEGSGNKVYDKSGNGNDGELKNGVVWTAGKFGSALSFDGTDDYVDAGTGINIASKSFSLVAWAKRDSIDTVDYIFGQGTTSTNHGLHFGFRSTNVFTFAFYYNDLDTPNAYTDNNWHLWVGTYDATTNERKIYRDGVLVASDTASADYQGTGTLYIGRATWGDYFDGTIDEVRIWNKALTPDQTVVMKMV